MGNLYKRIISVENLFFALLKARKGKTNKPYVQNFEKDWEMNLLTLHQELKDGTYFPRPLKTFILRDPKTRKISKSHFRDRIVQHALINIIGQILEKSFIYDSCANQIGKGTSFALKRFDTFRRKVTKNNKRMAFCLKADIRHYFEEVDHEILMNIIKRKINDEETLELINKINTNSETQRERVTFWLESQNCQSAKKGIPLGNLTSQFFANVYLHEMDYFVKHRLKAKYYIRYVDDFVIFHKSRKQLEVWRQEINRFLKEKLKLELHPLKSKIFPLSRGVDFVGFRNFCNYKLVRKRNIRKMIKKIKMYEEGAINFSALKDSHQGWQAYVKWADSFKLRREILREIYKIKEKGVKHHLP